MIELLGVGVPREEGGWLLHRVCARTAPQALIVIVSREPTPRQALLDVISGRRLQRTALYNVAVLAATIAADPIVRLADRVVALGDGLLLYDGPAIGFAAARARHRTALD